MMHPFWSYQLHYDGTPIHQRGKNVKSECQVEAVSLASGMTGCCNHWIPGIRPMSREPYWHHPTPGCDHLGSRPRGRKQGCRNLKLGK